jgi:hypothetical protein
MSDLPKVGTGSDNQTPAAIDLTKYVPKEDFEKTSASVKELESKLDEAKLSLLQPEYLEFMESKRAGKVEKKIESSIDKLLDSKDLDKLSPRQVLALSIEKAKEAVEAELLPKYQDQMRKMGQSLSDVLAVLELQEVEKKHSDFGEYRDDIRKILETSATPLTIEQAYLLAKAGKGGSFTPNAPKAPNPSEKPIGGTPPGSMVTKTFKTKQDAGEDAWNSVVGAGKDYI